MKPIKEQIHSSVEGQAWNNLWASFKNWVKPWAKTKIERLHPIVSMTKNQLYRDIGRS